MTDNTYMLDDLSHTECENIALALDFYMCNSTGKVDSEELSLLLARFEAFLESQATDEPRPAPQLRVIQQDMTNVVRVDFTR